MVWVFFFSDLIPVTSHFQVWKLLWYLYSGLAHFVRRCITWRREPGRVFGGNGRLLPPQGCCLARAAHPALPCKTRGPAKSTGVGLHTLFRFQAGLYRDQSESLPAGKLWKCVMKSVYKLSLSLRGTGNTNETKKLPFEVASYSSSSACKGFVKLCERNSNFCLEPAPQFLLPQECFFHLSKAMFLSTLLFLLLELHYLQNMDLCWVACEWNVIFLAIQLLYLRKVYEWCEYMALS